MALFRESLIAIELAPTGVSIAECAGDRVLKSASFSWPSHLDATTQPQLAGQWLAQQLATVGIGTRKAVLVVPRQHAPLKLLDAPFVADDELAAIVQLQAESRLSKPLDEFLCDFIAHPIAAGASTRRVLLGTVLKSVFDSQLLVVQAAGLSVIGATVAEAAVPLVVEHVSNVVGKNRRTVSHEDASATQSAIDIAVIAAADQSVLIASQHGRALSSLPVRLRGDDYSATDDARLVMTSTTRLLATLSIEHGAASVGAVTVCGSVSGTFVTALQTQLPSRLNRFADSLPGPLVRLVAAVEATSHRDGAINFLAPRRPVDQVAQQRRYYARVGAAAAALLALAGWTYWDQGRELDAQIAAKKKELAQLNQLIERGQPIVETSAFVSDWQRGQYDWAREFKHLSEQLPDRERLHLNRLTFETKSQTGAAHLRASGAARDPRDVADLTEKLVAAERYELQPKSITPNSRDASFRAGFEIEAAIVEEKMMP